MNLLKKVFLYIYQVLRTPQNLIKFSQFINILQKNMSRNCAASQADLDARILENKKNLSQMQRQLQMINKQINEAQSEAMRISDPEYFKKAKKDIYKRFIGMLNSLPIKCAIPKQNGIKHCLFVGHISAGKSSLINFLFGANQEVGVGETTGIARSVVQYKIPNTQISVCIWDTPGFNQDFSHTKLSTIEYFLSADKIAILYNKSMKPMLQTIKLITTITKNEPNKTLLVRTQIDQIDNNKPNHKSLEDTLIGDKKILYEEGIPNKLFAVSSFRNMDYRDNKALFNEIINFE